MFNANELPRLLEQVKAAGIAVGGARSDGSVWPASLQASAQSIIDNFDHSDAAQQAWVDGKTSSKISADPDYNALQQALQNAINNNSNYLNISSPTNTQVVGQVKSLTQEINKLLPAVAKILNQINK